MSENENEHTHVWVKSDTEEIDENGEVYLVKVWFCDECGETRLR